MTLPAFTFAAECSDNSNAVYEVIITEDGIDFLVDTSNGITHSDFLVNSDNHLEVTWVNSSGAGTYTVSTTATLCCSSHTYEYTLEIVDCATIQSAVANNPVSPIQYTIGDEAMYVSYIDMFTITPAVCASHLNYGTIITSDYKTGTIRAVKHVGATI